MFSCVWIVGRFCSFPAAAAYNSHSSHVVDVPIGFLDNAQAECDHDRHAASNAAHKLRFSSSLEDQSAQNNMVAAEKDDLTSPQSRKLRTRSFMQTRAEPRYRLIRCFRKLARNRKFPHG